MNPGIKYSDLVLVTSTVVLIFLINSAPVEGLKCYVCNSAFHKGCDVNPPPEQYLTECSKFNAKPVDVQPHNQQNIHTIPVSKKKYYDYSENSQKNKGIVVSGIIKLRNSTQNHYGLGIRNERDEKGTNTNTTVFPSISHLRRLGSLDEDLNFTVCRKDDVTIPSQYNGEYFVKEGTRRIVRSCGWMGRPETICVLDPNEELDIVQCTCTYDGCNSSQKLKLTSVLLLITGVWNILVVLWDLI